MLLSSVLFLFCYGLSAAQQVEVRRSHPVSLNRIQTDVPTTGTLTVLAVMVEFQPDDNRFTSGNGTFGAGSLPYLEENPVSIDPLPHNRDYFESHLRFVNNYFESVSGGQLNLDFSVHPQPVRLDQPMSFYAPTGEQFTARKLALLARDTWQKVEEAGGFDDGGLHPEHTAFVIFHAGVGRDIQLTGTTLDKTPQDIPSIYLSKQSLSELLEDPSFQGFPVNNGSFRITNSLILPRTLSRRGENVTGDEFVLQLSTNGLICATIGSHLGLPDLFNTLTGNSGIGRFGLMDGESFFSYNGLFPPEPSAWEKIRLGWQASFEIDLDNAAPVQLPAAVLHQPASIARFSLSPGEYFLVENRHRDPDNDGITLSIRRPDGGLTQQSFTNRDEIFVFQLDGFTDLLEPGVLENVDQFDWSLPGGLDRGGDGEKDTPDDRILNGGMLIWHIDEAVIRSEIASQTVNADPDRRGVDLEEADGSQDIGSTNGNLNGQFSRGTPFDFWWRGNNASVVTREGDTLSFYENRFGPDTRPDNSSNSGAISFFEFFDFSENRTVATFRARSVTSEQIRPVPLSASQLPDSTVFTASGASFLQHYPLSLSLHTALSDSFLIIPTQSTVWALQLNGNSPSPFDFQKSNPQQPFSAGTVVLADQPGNGSAPIDIESWEWNGSGWQEVWSSVGDPNKGFLSSVDGQILLLDLTDNRFNLEDGAALPDLPENQQRSINLDGAFSVIAGNRLTVTGSDLDETVNPGSDRIYTGAIELTSDDNGFYLFENNTFSLIDPGGDPLLRNLFTSIDLDWPAFADINTDGRIDIAYLDLHENALKAVNINGALLDHFPITPPVGARFIGTPLILDIESDGSPDLLIPAQDSLSLNIYGYGANGRPKEGFPLFVGEISESGNQPVHPALFGNILYAVSHTGTIKAWEFENADEIQWNGRYGPNRFNKVTGRISGSNPVTPVTRVLVDRETYNWPNPADDETHIRYQTRGAGRIQVKVIDLSGRIIFEESYSSLGGPPEEQRISTAGWGSGIYLALIKATVNGESAEKLIKIAVTH
ncbi:MAG: T9SS type A sorting domain-containing protein [Balneolaceae bacterium]|nr:T9SS type A sorting domain-containing protein [Balneolaceae bacterium]